MAMRGCKSIVEMGKENGEYASVWRAGGDRYKRFGELKVVYKEIVKQNTAYMESYMDNMCALFFGKPGGAISTPSRKIQMKYKEDREKGIVE